MSRSQLGGILDGLEGADVAHQSLRAAAEADGASGFGRPLLGVPTPMATNGYFGTGEAGGLPGLENPLNDQSQAGPHPASVSQASTRSPQFKGSTPDESRDKSGINDDSKHRAPTADDIRK